MTKIKCFWLEPASFCETFYRRHGAWEDGKHFHSAKHLISAKEDYPLEEAGRVDATISREALPEMACECGYIFTPEDAAALHKQRLYARSDTGALTTLTDAPVGAMWDADWFKGLERYQTGEDGVVLAVKTPGGDWCVDGPATRGSGGWVRTGKIPNVTASPSILMPSYHGWLKAGYLEEC